MNILVSSAGRRGALIEILRKAARRRGGRIFAIDASPWSAACRLADDWRIVPRCDDPSFTSTVLDYCEEHGVKLIVPTIDPELAVYAQHQELFQNKGITIAVSSPEVISICGDKLQTDRFLRSAQLPGVECVDQDEALTFPLIIKPRFGSASSGVQIVHDLEEFNFYLKRTPKPIVQRLASGNEYTVNFYVDQDQRCRIAVPHRRVETRGGEVSKCITENVPELTQLANQLAQSLPGAWGAMCFQAFVDEHRNVRTIEINPRFGGGYPIASHAGADFAELLIQETLEEALPSEQLTWQAGVAMTRWDDSVFIHQSELRGAA